MRALLITVLFTGFAAAQAPADMTAQQQARAVQLYKEVRCPTCVAQAVAESDANLSKDMRRRIDALIVAGKTDEEILDSLSASYGDDIRLRPKQEGRTVLLWLTPWLLIGAGLLWVWRTRRS